MAKALLVVCVVVVITAVAYANVKSSYWQTFINTQNRDLKSVATSKTICFPKETFTKQTLGNIVSRNSSMVCIETTLAVRQFDTMGWKSDFKATKGVMKVVITSCPQRFMANLLSNFSIFVSTKALHRKTDLSTYKGKIQICARYNGTGFKPNERMKFVCRKIVHGRYLYIWGLGTKRIQSVSISKIEFEFSVDVEKGQRGGGAIMPNHEHTKEFLTYFSRMSQWGQVVHRGFWIMRLGAVMMVENLFIGVNPAKLASIGGMVVDIGTLKNNTVIYAGNKRSSLSADKKAYIVNVHLRGNAIQIKGSKGNGWLGEDAVEYVEMMANNGKSNIFFKETIRVIKKIWKSKAVLRPNILGRLSVWQNDREDATGWIMVDMGKRYMVTGVSILSGSKMEVMKDLQGLVIATTNFIPNKVITDEEKTEMEVCAVVGVHVRVLPNKEAHFKCLPNPSLGAFVLIFNKLKPLRLYAIKVVKVFVALDKDYYFTFKLPFFPRVPPRPSKSSLANTFFISNYYTPKHPHGFWVVELKKPSVVTAVIVTAGKVSSELKSFVVYVQNSIRKDLTKICANFMSKKFLPGKTKYLECTPRPRTGRFVIVASENGYCWNAIGGVEVRLKDKKGVMSYASPPISPLVPRTSTHDIPLEKALVWRIRYPTIQYSSVPMGFVLVDLRTPFKVVAVTLSLKYDSKALKPFKEMFVSLTNNPTLTGRFICAYQLNIKDLTRHQASSYHFECANQQTAHRYILIRNDDPKQMLPISYIKFIQIVILTGKTFKHVTVDLRPFSRAVPDTQIIWSKAAPVQSVVSDGTYQFDFTTPVHIVMVEMTVENDMKASTVSVLLNNVDNMRNFHVCYWFSPVKSFLLSKASSYKMKCSYRKEAIRYAFVNVKEDGKVTKNYLRTIKFTLLDNNKYYYYLWDGSQSAFGETTTPWFIHLGWQTEIAKVEFTSTKAVEPGFQVALFNQTLSKYPYPTPSPNLCFNLRKATFPAGKVFSMDCNRGIKGTYMYFRNKDNSFDPTSVISVRVFLYEPKSKTDSLGHSISKVSLARRQLSSSHLKYGQLGNILDDDYNRHTFIVISSDLSTKVAWLKVDLGKTHVILGVTILSAKHTKLENFKIGISDSRSPTDCSRHLCAHHRKRVGSSQKVMIKCSGNKNMGRYLFIWKETGFLAMAGLGVYASPVYTIEYSLNPGRDNNKCSSLTKESLPLFRYEDHSFKI